MTPKFIQDPVAVNRFLLRMVKNMHLPKAEQDLAVERIHELLDGQLWVSTSVIVIRCTLLSTVLYPDEATASIDDGSEALVQGKCQSLAAIDDAQWPRSVERRSLRSW
jgi:hypothetical protein